MLVPVTEVPEKYPALHVLHPDKDLSAALSAV